MIVVATGILRRAAANWRNRRRSGGPAGPARDSRFQLEPLEPRVLLSGDVALLADLNALDNGLVFFTPVVLPLDNETGIAATETSDASNYTTDFSIAWVDEGATSAE